MSYSINKYRGNGTIGLIVAIMSVILGSYVLARLVSTDKSSAYTVECSRNNIPTLALSSSYIDRDIVVTKHDGRTAVYKIQHGDMCFELQETKRL